MRFDLWKYSTKCAGVAAMIAAVSSVSAGSLHADEEDVVIEVVAAADDAPPAEDADVKKKRGVVQESGRRIDAAAGGEEEVELVERAVEPGHAIVWTQRVGGEEMGRFWIGVQCRGASPDLRAQLGLDE